MTIRPVASLDELTAAIQLICAQVTDMISPGQQPYRDVPRYFPEYQALMLIAEVGDQMVGAVVGYGPEMRTASQFSALAKGLGVHPDHRGEGIGRLLMAEFERRAAAMGATEIYLGAVPSARGFYSRIGYSGRSRMRKALTGNGIARYGSAEQRAERLKEMRARRQGSRLHDR